MTPAPPKKSVPRSERGAALITVLFMVTVMAALSVSLFDQVRFDILKTQSRQLSVQARWFAVGAEQLAVKVLQESIGLSPERTTLNDPWAVMESRFPIPGGFIDGKLSDAGNCFNINSLVSQSESQELEPNEATSAQLITLLLALEIDETTAEEIAGRLTDWVDSDTQASDRGAEDFDYLALSPAYRTANTFMHDTTELRAIDGMTPALSRLIQPVLCAQPSTDPSLININTLPVERAALLVMLTDGEMPLDTAISVLQQRPVVGWATVDEFLALPAFSETPVPATGTDLLTLKSRYFTLNTVVAIEDALVQLETRFDADQPNRIKLLSRRFGEDV